jgi:hypothetical protein
MWLQMDALVTVGQFRCVCRKVNSGRDRVHACTWLGPDQIGRAGEENLPERWLDVRARSGSHTSGLSWRQCRMREGSIAVCYESCQAQADQVLSSTDRLRLQLHATGTCPVSVSACGPAFFFKSTQWAAYLSFIEGKNIFRAMRTCKLGLAPSPTFPGRCRCRCRNCERRTMSSCICLCNVSLHHALGVYATTCKEGTLLATCLFTSLHCHDILAS